jgi:hypothetical protein
MSDTGYRPPQIDQSTNNAAPQAAFQPVAGNYEDTNKPVAYL